MTELPQILQRLLGPAAPEIGCDECFDLTDRYVDAELGDASMPEELAQRFRAHLDGCPACREEYESLRLLVGD